MHRREFIFKEFGDKFWGDPWTKTPIINYENYKHSDRLDQNLDTKKLFF